MDAQLKVSPGLPADPVNRGSVMGWGVYRFDPWYLFGVCASEPEAEIMKGQAGEDCFTAYGSHKLGSDDFVPSSNQVGG